MKSSYKVFLKKFRGWITPPWGVSSQSGDQLRPQWSWSIEGELPHFQLICTVEVPPVRMSLPVCSPKEVGRGFSVFFFLKGCTGVGLVGVKWKRFPHARSTRENLEFCFHLHQKVALFFYFPPLQLYGFSLLLFKSLILVSQIWKKKEEKRKIAVSHDICCHQTPGLPAGTFRWWIDHSVERFVKQSNNSSNLSDIHKSIDQKAAFTHNHKW